MKDIQDDIAALKTGIEHLDPENEYSIVYHLRGTAESAQTALQHVISALHSFMTKLPLKDGTREPYEKALEALTELKNSSDWKKVEELDLLLRAALGGLSAQLDKITEKK